MEPQPMAAEWLLEHLEAGLGPLDESRSAGERSLRADDGTPFGVLAFGGAERGAYASFGISRHLLAGEAPRQELVVAVADRSFAINLISVIGRSILERHQALADGERHRTPGWNDASLIVGTMAVPDPDVSPMDRTTPPIHFVRLLPITDAEAAYAGRNGWQALAQVFADDGVNLDDLFRPSAIS